MKTYKYSCVFDPEAAMECADFCIQTAIKGLDKTQRRRKDIAARLEEARDLVCEAHQMLADEKENA